MHIEMPLKDSSIETTLPFSTEATGFQSFLNIDLSDVVARTNLSFAPLLRAEKLRVRTIASSPAFQSLVDLSR